MPAAPTALSAAAVGSGHVALSWTAPSDNGSAITGYTVDEYTGATATGTPVVISTGSTTPSYTVTGLTNGQEYTSRSGR